MVLQRSDLSMKTGTYVGQAFSILLLDERSAKPTPAPTQEVLRRKQLEHGTHTWGIREDVMAQHAKMHPCHTTGRALSVEVNATVLPTP